MELQTYESINRIRGLDTGPRRRALAGLAQAIRALTALVNACVVAPLRHEINIRRAVRHLEALDDRLLDDLGLKQWDIEQAVRDNVRAGDRRHAATPRKYAR
jgi:uncharacterized protein YjiS (DUF1127 family)